MLELKPVYLKKNGKNEFVVLTVAEFERIKEALEDIEDSRILQASKRRGGKSRTITLEAMKGQLGLSPAKRMKGK